MKNNKKIINTILSNEQYNWLKQAKKQRLQSMTAIIRELLNKEIANETKDFTNQ